MTTTPRDPDATYTRKMKAIARAELTQMILAWLIFVACILIASFLALVPA